MSYLSSNNLVSVCVPTYNGDRYLQNTLDSINNQTYKDIEVIFSDDNSSDSTLAIIEEFKSKVAFPVYIYHHEPSGIGANWNHCIENSRGKYIKFIFQDDVMDPGCIEKMIEVLHAYPTIGAVASHRRLIIENSYQSNQVAEWIEKYSDLQASLNLEYCNHVGIVDKSIFKHKSFFNAPFNKIGEPSVVMFERSLYDQIGPFNTRLKQYLDYEYWYRILKYYRFAIIDVPLVSFRLHFGQTTAANNRNGINEYSKYYRFIGGELFFCLSFSNKVRVLQFESKGLTKRFLRFLNLR